MLKLTVEALIGIGSIFTLYRLFKGPDVLDRLLGYSSFSAKIVLLLVAEGLLNNRSIYVNLALIYAILSFLGILIIGRYIEGEA